MTNSLGAPPALSTPDTHVFATPTSLAKVEGHARTNEDLIRIYEIERTIKKINEDGWRCVALQFPDEMLPDAPRVFALLENGMKQRAKVSSSPRKTLSGQERTLNGQDETLSKTRLYILGDTSYGACCVDEIAAEHVEADVVVHYGRACLSPTARLSVIHVFTTQPVSQDSLLQAFRNTYPDQGQKIFLMADLTYSSYIPIVAQRLRQEGYANLYTPSIVHDPSSLVPNRTVPSDALDSPSALKEWHLFHISDPPQSLLLTLSSRVSSIHIFPTGPHALQDSQSLVVSTKLALQRRYALLTSLSTASVLGILINTLSVKNYLHVVEKVKARIEAAGKKSYTFVMGKLNAAKIANFSEVDGWVVIGCWESSLIESKDFWKPVITHYELEIALKGDGNRLWTGDWRSDFCEVLADSSVEPFRSSNGGQISGTVTAGETDMNNESHDIDSDSEPESAPPEFDLRTGRYVSHSHPMWNRGGAESRTPVSGSSLSESDKALTNRTKGDMAVVGNRSSPGAAFLQSKRTWKGLGSDFNIAYDETETNKGAPIEEGRSGIARGYTNGDHSTKK
ncbi:Diphthamide biosynthesis protein 2 [Loxospora ochrophaea]|nr:Diphthamide biosynthesis protein 2 [Loxospora ochrophaea]